MSASKKPPNSASKLRPSLLGGGSSTKGDKTPSRGPMLRMPWGARTPKRSAADSAADYLGVERRCVHTAYSTIGSIMSAGTTAPPWTFLHQ